MNGPVVVLGGTGKIGRRLVERLTRRYIPVRIGSRAAGLPFDWDQREPFSDAEDIADVAVTVLTEDGHVGEVYELTGPRALTFAEATAAIAAATGRDVDLFGTVLDGRNAAVTDGVERVLQRPARDFADYARATAATGVWNPTDQPNPGSTR